MELKQEIASIPNLIEKLKSMLDNIEAILSNKDLNHESIKEITDKKISYTKNVLSSVCNLNSDCFIALIVDMNDDPFEIDLSIYNLKKSSKIEKEVARLEKFQDSLKVIIDYLLITDSLDKTNIAPSLSIIEKSDFLLNKLNKVFGDQMYSISKILDIHNIKYRIGEPREIGEDLSRRGYLILQEHYGNSDFVMISVKGAAYIERKSKSKSVKRKKENIESKINQITKMLIELGYGQETIFNEIDEIRDLYTKLNNKNWKESVKGKLIDLGLSQIINKEIVSQIYEILIDDKLKLLK